MMQQANLTEYGTEYDGWPPVGRDECGPTAHEPLPPAERGRTRLEEWGFNAVVLSEEAFHGRCDRWARADLEPRPDVADAMDAQHAGAVGSADRDKADSAESREVKPV